MMRNFFLHGKARPISLLGLCLLFSQPDSYALNLDPINAIVDQDQVTGIIKDEKGQVLAGATITVKGTSVQTSSNQQGIFSIRAKRGDVLVVNYQGFTKQEVVVSAGNVNVVMVSSDQALEEVVIIGYGKQRKGNITGSVATVNAEQLKNIPSSNLSNSLAGRAAGVNVTNTSGMAGASSSLRIRGSFAEPLYVIDGVVRDKAAFDVLEANEVDQMTFLKDAATAAVYGTRAGNGVVVVTTKKGTAQAPVFNVQSNYTFNTPTQELLANLTTAKDELTYQNRVAEFRGLSIPNGQKEFDYFKDKNYNANDVIWRNPFTHRQSISVNGGGDKITYYSLLSYRKENGSYKSLDHEKFNLRSNISAQITEDFSMDFNISANQTN